MRMMLKVSIPVEAGNKGVKDGSLPKTVSKFVEAAKPETVFFTAEGGCRTGFFVFDLKDPLRPRVAAQFGDIEGFTHPHSYLRLPGGHVLATFQMRHEKAGMVPGVIYGQDVEATAVMAPSILATKVWRTAGRHHPVELTLGGKTQLAMIKSADLDPVKHSLRHLSLHIVRQNEMVDTQVPVKVRGEGETPAEKAGLVVLQALESVEIQAIPANLPDFLEVPGEKLAEQGDHLTVADILPVKGVEIATDPSIVVVSVYEPGALAAQNEAAAGEGGEVSEVEAENGEASAEESAPAVDEKSKQ